MVGNPEPGAFIEINNHFKDTPREANRILVRFLFIFGDLGKQFRPPSTFERSRECRGASFRPDRSG
jgi:hypothetical protein